MAQEFTFFGASTAAATFTTDGANFSSFGGRKREAAVEARALRPSGEREDAPRRARVPS